MALRQPMRLMHVITGLNRGGAEMMLYKLLVALDRDCVSSCVVSLTDEGNVGAMIRSLDIPIMAMGLRPGRPDPTAILRLALMMRRRRVQLTQCWMYHADFIGGIAARVARVPVIWGIRQSNFDADSSKQATMRIMNWCARLSGWVPNRIAVCSETAARVHVRHGYRQDKMVVIPNGFQTDLFAPDEAVRREMRRTLGLPDGRIVIGVVGRFDPQKDHRLFVQAAGGLARARDDLSFVFCGDGLNSDNPELMGWIATEGIEARCLLLGRRDDVRNIYCAMDIMVSSSAYGEGFPNVIGEAMSCGVPCVVTDVGDSALIVGDTGRVVAPRDPVALAAAVAELAALSPDERRALGAKARRRIVENYDLPAIAARYMALYEEVIGPCAA